MTSPALHGDRLGGAGRLAAWIGAAVLITSAYALGVGWLMQRPVEADGADETLPAIMIELAEEPVAVNVDDNVASVSETDSQEVKTEETQPLPEPAVEEKVEPKPVEDSPEPDPVVEEEPEVEPPAEAVKRDLPPDPVPPVEEEDPVVEAMTKVMDNVAAPLPMVRPQLRAMSETPPEKKIERKKPRKKRVVTAQKSDAAVKASAKVRQAKTTAAKVASEGASRASVDRWKSRVAAHIQRRKRRLALAGAKAERDVIVRFRIDDAGNILSVSVSRSSGSDEFDRAAVAMVQNSSPVPAPPEGVNKSIRMPVGFNMR